MINKTITIREEQALWIKANHLKLSQFVRDKLDERIAMDADCTFIEASKLVKK